jgi:hypothetical protein
LRDNRVGVAQGRGMGGEPRKKRRVFAAARCGPGQIFRQVACVLL